LRFPLLVLRRLHTGAASSDEHPAIEAGSAIPFYTTCWYIGVILALAGTSFILYEGRRRYERKLNLDLTWAEAGEKVCEWSNFKSCPQSSP
jgi:hypothetical protein